MRFFHQPSDNPIVRSSTHLSSPLHTTGYFLGCAAIGAHVAEVPSIAVRPEARGLKAGSKLLPYLRYLKDQRREFSSLQKMEHKL
jgi:GNAT superfamily N-acetyltransferase